MFWFHLRLRNPFSKRDDAYIHNYYNKVWRITKNKSIDIQIARWNNLTNLIDIQFNIEPSGHDHAGADFNVTLLHFYFMIHLYDRRHWDYDNNCWREVYREENEIIT